MLKYYQIILRRDQFLFYSFNVQMHLQAITAQKIFKKNLYIHNNHSQKTTKFNALITFLSLDGILFSVL